MVRWRGAEQDVAGHGLVQHGAARAGVGRTLAVAAHALVRQRPVQGAPGGQAAHLKENIHWSFTVTAELGCSAPFYTRGQLDMCGGKSGERRQESIPACVCEDTGESGWFPFKIELYANLKCRGVWCISFCSIS